jgi:hypothetical protein
MMMITRRPAILLSLMLAACSSDLPASTYVPPSSPTQTAIVAGATAAAAEEKLAGPLQISAVRPTDLGPGQYFICLRQANPPPDPRLRYYSVFFDNDTSKGSRLSIIMEECETQAFSPLPTAAPSIPAAAADAKPARQKAARSSTH